MSRNGHTFKHWPHLCQELAHAIKAHDAVVDGEIVYLDSRGRSNCKSLLFRRDWPFFYAFDLLAADEKDVRDWPFIERQAVIAPAYFVSADAAAVCGPREGSRARLLPSRICA